MQLDDFRRSERLRFQLRNRPEWSRGWGPLHSPHATHTFPIEVRYGSGMLMLDRSKGGSSVMTKGPRKKSAVAEIELVPDAWPRFERFIREIVKAGPQHRETPKPKRAKMKRHAK